MRLISQNGESDIPYERIAVELSNKDKTKIIGYGVDGFDGHWMLAKYSTEEKTRKVMELLRMAYAGQFIATASVSDNFGETMKELTKHSFGTVIVKKRF